jgi:hypothetical protein
MLLTAATASSSQVLLPDSQPLLIYKHPLILAALALQGTARAAVKPFDEDLLGKRPLQEEEQLAKRDNLRERQAAVLELCCLSCGLCY